jgi:hypothetical protein
MDDTSPLHSADLAHLQRVGQTIPSSTPRPQLSVLDSRYTDLTDPMIAQLPDWYRVAIRGRIDQLLTASRPLEPDR